jgi:hypothetical protein
MVQFLIRDFQGNLISKLENSFSDWFLKEKILMQAGFKLYEHKYNFLTFEDISYKLGYFYLEKDSNKML